MDKNEKIESKTSPFKPLKWLVIFLLLVAIGVASWFGYNNFYDLEENVVKPSGIPIKTARYYWPGSYWIEIADQKGWFEEAGLNVQLIDSNPDYYQSLQDMVDGKMDVNGFSLFDIISYKLTGADLVLVINADSSFGSEGIVAREGIADVEDLKGKRVGVDIGIYTDYILGVALDEHGLSFDDIDKVSVLGEQAAEELASGNVDAIVTWEPIISQAVENGGTKIFDTSEISGISPNGQAFNKSFINEHPEDVQAYVNVWYKTTEFIKKNPEEAFGIIAGIYSVSREEVESFGEVDKILDLKDNQTSFSYAGGFESLHGAARRMNDFMIEAGLTDKSLDSTQFIESKFINRVE